MRVFCLCLEFQFKNIINKRDRKWLIELRPIGSLIFNQAAPHCSHSQMLVPQMCLVFIKFHELFSWKSQKTFLDLHQNITSSSLTHITSFLPDSWKLKKNRSNQGQLTLKFYIFVHLLFCLVECAFTFNLQTSFVIGLMRNFHTGGIHATCNTSGFESGLWRNSPDVLTSGWTGHHGLQS